MCHKLLQVYACGHMKTICTTPCPHAIDTSRQIAASGNHPDLSRSSSVASSITSKGRSHWQDLTAKSHLQDQHSPGLPSPLRVGTGLEEQEGPPPAFRFVPPGQRPLLSPPLEYHHSRTVSLTLSNFPPSESAFSVRVSPTLVTSPSISFETDPQEPTPEPDFCAYYFPRYLPQSWRPCLQCYMQPEWENQRKAWMASYRMDHPAGKPEDVERLSGIEMLREGL
ncbi:hypothetical protein BKA66DRAFT_437506 [Pyrenochaeta sp. MPI-SDFR-AT-0127]|nr:hypothetical protein BKA66DRAFT_437506 [Pyrenochaeta sp. MPI-SDFR-AT-0127]